MKVATQTRRFKEDYDWSAPDENFKSFADHVWMLWHAESYPDAWFGLFQQNGNILFLSGNIPTERQDRVHRHIVDTIVLQPETAEDITLVTSLTADLLTERQDINSSQSEFTKWVDEICFAAAEEEKYIFPEVTFCSPLNSIDDSEDDSEESNLLGRFEYPLDSQNEKTTVAKALSNLLNSQTDFVVGCINCPTNKVIDKVCNTLTKNAQIAIFSSKVKCKNEIPVPVLETEQDDKEHKQVPTFLDLDKSEILTAIKWGLKKFEDISNSQPDFNQLKNENGSKKNIKW